MATKRFCDRCNKDITDRGEVVFISRNSAASNVRMKYELCADCDIQFARDFMNPPEEWKPNAQSRFSKYS